MVEGRGEMRRDGGRKRRDGVRKRRKGGVLYSQL